MMAPSELIDVVQEAYKNNRGVRIEELRKMLDSRKRFDHPPKTLTCPPRRRKRR